MCPNGPYAQPGRLRRLSRLSRQGGPRAVLADDVNTRSDAKADHRSKPATYGVSNGCVPRTPNRGEVQLHEGRWQLRNQFACSAGVLCVVN